MTKEQKNIITKAISKEIIDEIVSVFENNIENEVFELKSQIEGYQYKINNVIEDLNREIKHSKEAIENIKEDGFTAILIEEEGYLRGIMIAMKIMSDYKLKIE